MNNDHHCIDKSSPEKVCWIAVLTNPGVDITRVQDDIVICHACERFKTVSERGIGRRAADKAISVTIAKLMEQLALKRENLETASIELKKNIEQLSLLKNITDAIARSDSLEKGLRIILTGATSGDAFGFNRAAVFLVNEDNGFLEGRCAIGPENPEEAKNIWNEIAHVSISTMLEKVMSEKEFTPCSLENLAANARISIDDGDNPLVQSLIEARCRIIDVQDIWYSRLDWSFWPSAGIFAAAPLISEGRPLGLLIADNAITQKPITAEMVDALKALANACAPGLENAMLRQQLMAQLKELKGVHELLKSNQTYLVKNERLVEIGMLATKVAHELKIPLVTIGGYARRVKSTLETNKFDKEMVDIIIAEVDRLLMINSEILEFSRGARLNIRDCDLHNVVGDSLNLLKERFKNSGIKAERKFCSSRLTIKADPERLKQVILNLIENSVEAMNRGGKLIVRTIRQNDYVVLEIEDTGVGMDKESLDNLFKLFYTTKEKGSGLGLPVSKKIIDDHGGTISVRSIPGSGTVFSVHLPACDNSVDSANH
jgi:signal transduction histidine kinase